MMHASPLLTMQEPEKAMEDVAMDMLNELISELERSRAAESIDVSSLLARLACIQQAFSETGSEKADLRRKNQVWCASQLQT